MSSAATERELKFAGADHSALRERLTELEAESQGSPALEDNWLLESTERPLTEGHTLRLRVDRRGAQLTLNGPSSFEERVKVSQELNIGVSDVEQTLALLAKLGFEPAHRYQKYCEEWHLGSVVIALDHTPIGDFVDFAGAGCERVAKRCGLDLSTAERRHYLRLYRDYRANNPQALPDMVFP